MIGVFHADTPPAVPTDTFSLLVPIFLALVSTAYIVLSKMLGMHHLNRERQQSFPKTYLDSLVNTLDQQRKKIANTLHNYKIQADKSRPPPPIPTVSLRAGDKTHDKEYRENQDKFLIRCRAETGPVFKLSIHRLQITVVSDEFIREMFLNKNFSNVDALNELMGVKTFLHSLIKSGKNHDARIQNSIILEHLTPDLPRYLPEMVRALEAALVEGFGSNVKGKVFESPVTIIQDMVAGTVFMGAEVANNPKVLETFVMSMHDFAGVLGLNDINIPFWRRWLNLKLNHFNNPLKHRVRTLAEAATPVILERRRREARLINEGADAPQFIKERPHDILQKMLDRFDKYGFVDLEDICGHIMLLILTSVHTTIDASTAMVYYLATYPETIPILHREQIQVLDAIQQERQQERASRLSKGLEISPDLDPSHDRDLTTKALKRMAHLDSFQREVLRCRTEALTHFHMARKETILSNGMVISKYGMMLANLTSTHANNAAAHGLNPAKFQPWRYVGTFKTMTKVGVDFLPFGMGKHVCPGRFMASQQTKIVVSLMVSKFEKIEFQDPSQAARVLRTQHGNVASPALVFTSRE
ncbi:hypothetical protein BG015_001484 [Linnemannia schmuckeri]|uniref:Cytochrome P450 n=1 Tax=Linnemannia schmuckeri TaxID=64567 RepID=A0A9P5VDT4_9FUNG|nr:hypothetical protein BG015_001484 [Linnemannia schmuckeri]